MTNSEMTSYQRVMVALEGGKPDCVPVLPIAHSWPVGQVGFNVFDIYNSVEKQVYSQYHGTKNFGYDCVHDLPATGGIAEAIGSKFKLQEKILPSMVEPFLKDYNTDLQKIGIINPYKDGQLPNTLESIKRVKMLCKNEVPVVAYLQGPLRCAGMVRGLDKLFIDMKKNKENLHTLLDVITINELFLGIAQAHAGADIILLIEPTSSMDTISRTMWEEYGFGYTKQLVTHLKKTGVKVILHICGNVIDRLDSFIQLGVDGISLDEIMDLSEVRKIVGEKICLMGNICPTNVVLNSSEEIRVESKVCIEKGGKNGAFILSGGCQIPFDGKAENIKALVETGHNYKY